jgi:hypothetical protein
MRYERLPNESAYAWHTEENYEKLKVYLSNAVSHVIT